MSKLLEIVKSFLHQRLNKTTSILLGYSGGSDSKALLYSLLKLKEMMNFELHVAHVDHKWRKCSTKEAKMLKREVEALKLPFHLKTLSSLKKNDINKEAYYRERRLEFFSKLMKKYKLQALILAHHKDDLAETVLKRIFEGAGLPFLGAIAPVSKIHGMVIWRPLLGVDKQEILKFLKQEGIKNFIDDKTNYDTRFLRARMRAQIMPYLEEIFGKNIKQSLEFISLSAYELREYLDKKVNTVLKKIKKGKLGSWLECSHLKKMEVVERRYVLRHMLQDEGILLSRENIDLLLKWTGQNVVNKRIKLKNHQIIVDKNIIFIIKNIAPFVGVLKVAKNKKTKNGVWQVFFTKRGKCSLGWRNFLQHGELHIPLPFSENYFLKIVDDSDKKHFYKRLSDDKIPIFLRDLLPALYWGEEYLTHCYIERVLTRSVMVGCNEIPKGEYYLVIKYL